MRSRLKTSYGVAVSFVPSSVQHRCGGGAEFSLALVAFVLWLSWRQPAWRVVLFCAGGGGLTLA